MAPAIALTIVAAIGLFLSLVNLVLALISGPPQVDPNAPEFLREMQAHSVGPFAAALQGLFVLLYGFIIFCMVQMMRMTSWIMALVGSILAMVSIGSCCCILGLPFGLWSIIILSQSDVKRAFEYQMMGK